MVRLGALAHGFVRIGDFERAAKALDAITGVSHEAAWLRDVGMLEIGKAQVAAGNIAAALQWAQASPLGNAKVSILELIAKAKVIAGDIDSAIHILAGNRRDVNPRTIEMAIMQLIERGNELSHAQTLFEEIRGRHAACVAQITVARFLAESGNAARAQALLKGARQIADSIEIDAWAQDCLGLIAWQQVGVGDFAGALATAGQLMVGEEEVFNEVVRSQVAAGDLAAARKTADAIRFDLERRSSHIYLGMSLIQSGDSAGGHRLIDEAVDFGGSLGDRIRIRIEAGKALAEAGDKAGSTRAFDQVRQLAETFVVATHRASAYSQIGEALLAIGDCSGALQALALGLQEKPSQFQLGHIALAQVKAGDLAAAKLATAALENSSDVLRAISRAEALAGDFDQASRTAGSIHVSHTRFALLTEIAIATAKAGKITDARRIAGGLPPDEKSKALSVIAECQAAAGDFTAAILSADEISDDRGTQSFTYREIAKSRVRAGNVEDALSWAKSLEPNPSLYIWALLGLAGAMRDGDPE